MRQLAHLFLFLGMSAFALFADVSSYRTEHLGHSDFTVAGATRALAQSLSFLQTFDGAAASPQPWTPTDWDIQVDGSGLQLMQAHHSATCGAPPATHTITELTDTVFRCNDHIMTAMNAGYGAIYLTPNAQVDFSAGEATVRFDLSTFRTVGRDWIELWVTPWEDNLVQPLEDWGPAYQGEPRRGVQLRMDGGSAGGTIFRGNVVRDFVASGLGAADWRNYELLFAPSASRRDVFELRISRTHVRFGMPAYNLWWVDTAVADLGWSRGIVQLSQHAYNPTKGCDDANGGADPGGGCANTWHWDNVSISPAVPFTILRGSPRLVSDATSNRVTFPSPAPPGAFLRFASMGGDNLEVSFNGGQTWQPAQRQAQEKSITEHWSSYWTPIPTGATSAQFRGQWNYAGPWRVQDPSIFASSAPSSQPTPTPIPTATPPPGSATPTPTASPTRPAATATATSTATATATRTPATGSQSVTFDDRAGQNQALNGQYPSGVIDWGTNKWYHSGPWRAFTTKSVSFSSAGVTSQSFTFLTPRRLVSLQAYNGGNSASTVTLACARKPTKSISLAAGQLATISTGWTGTCTTVTVGSTNGWDTNFDNLVHDAG
jgi:hypothetical protein